MHVWKGGKIIVLTAEDAVFGIDVQHTESPGVTRHSNVTHTTSRRHERYARAGGGSPSNHSRNILNPVEAT